MTLWDLAPDDQKDMARTFLETSSDAPWDMELDPVLPGGVRKHVRVRCAASLSPKGVHDGFEGVIRDRTSQRELECKLAESREALKNSERRFQSLVEDVPDAIFSLDPKGRFTFANRRLREVIGYDGEEAVGHRIVEFVVPEDAHVMEQLGTYIRHTHVHDNRGGAANAYDLHLPIGEGRIDFQGILRALVETGYDGTMTLEMKHSALWDSRRRIWRMLDEIVRRGGDARGPHAESS